MIINLTTIGKTKTKYVLEGLNEYVSRLKKYLRFEITEIPDVKNAGKLSEAEQKTAEGEAILKNTSASDTLILLDERGEQYTSRKFSAFIQGLMNSGKKRIIFVIGGPYGFSEEVYRRADGLLSLSKMTFNHEMARLFFTEQIYRAMTILKGEPYHHD